MELDRSFSGLVWKDAFAAIREQSKGDLGAILIVRGNEAHDEHLIQAHLSKVQDCLHLKLGGVLTLQNLDEAILTHLNCKKVDGVRFENYRRIAKAVLTRHEVDSLRLIVIDNCHKMGQRTNFFLMALMLELCGIVQFIFLVPEDHIRDFERLVTSTKGKLFINLLSRKYDIT